MNAEAEDELEDEGMTFWEHLAELRSRILRAAIFAVIGASAAWFLREEILQWLLDPFQAAWAEHFDEAPKVHFKGPADLFITYLKISIIGGIILALPFIFWQIWAFVAPGLYKKEKKFAIPFVGASTGLFLTGAYFGMTQAFPVAFAFMLSFATTDKAEASEPPSSTAPAAIQAPTAASSAPGTIAESSIASDESPAKAAPSTTSAVTNDAIAGSRSANPAPSGTTAATGSSTAATGSSTAANQPAAAATTSDAAGSHPEPTAAAPVNTNDPKAEQLVGGSAAVSTADVAPTAIASVPTAAVAVTAVPPIATTSSSPRSVGNAGPEIAVAAADDVSKVKESGGVVIEATIMVDDYIKFISRMLLAFGTVFELPVVVFFLSVAGLINHRHLIKFFRYFVVIAFATAAIFTPPDLMSQFLLAVPMTVLYGISIGIAYIFGKKDASVKLPGE